GRTRARRTSPALGGPPRPRGPRAHDLAGLVRERRGSLRRALPRRPLPRRRRRILDGLPARAAFGRPARRGPSRRRLDQRPPRLRRLEAEGERRVGPRAQPPSPARPGRRAAHARRPGRANPERRRHGAELAWLPLSDARRTRRTANGGLRPAPARPRAAAAR